MCTSEAVRQMKSYIAQHLQQPISLLAIARHVGYSPYHASRVFRKATGQSLFDYIRLQRLLAASERLRDRPDRIIDVALDFVFSSHEGFTRAFSRQFGMSPQTYRRRVKEVRVARQSLMASSHQKEAKAMEQQNEGTIFVQVIDRPLRKLILKRGIHAKDYFSYCEEVGCDLWETLSDIREAILEPCGFWLPQHLRRPGTSQYVQGVEVPPDFSGALPQGLECMELMPCQMMIFQGPPFEDEDFPVAIRHLQDQMRRYDPTLYGYEYADDLAPRFQMEPLGYRGYIEGRPVLPLAQKGTS